MVEDRVRENVFGVVWTGVSDGDQESGVRGKLGRSVRERGREVIY